MYTQLFNLLCTIADDEYHGKLPVHVRCILDEFANIGQIPKFDKLIATIRSREISASIILQSKAQLKSIYKDNAETIEGNCDTFLFLGGKEKPTLKDLSEVLGKETMHDYLTETKMLDYSNENIKQLIRERKWSDMAEFERLKAIYTFVRDEILFGYNVDDSVPASRVLRDGYGQCNTKGTLFMALLRACDIPCRVHGFTIDKKLQKGAMTGIVYRNAPQNVFHSWVEVYFENRWYELEAFILDMGYLKKLQAKYSECTGAFCGFGVAVKDFKNPVIDFDRNNTYIQSEGINQDFGVYDSPDELLKEHHQEMSRVKAFLYRNWGRHMMNRNVRKIRGK